MSNKEEFECGCFNPLGCYTVKKPRKPRPNQRGYRQIIGCKNIYEGETKDNGLIRKLDGHGKLIFKDKDYFQGDWKESKIKQTRKIKKIPLDNAEDIFLQNINPIYDMDKDTFNEQNTKKK